MASLLLVMITFLGGYTALVQNKLARVTMLVDSCPPTVKKLLTLTCNLAMMFLMAIVFMYSVKTMGLPVVSKQSTATLRIPMIYIYACMPISFGLMFYHTAVDTLWMFFGDSNETSLKEEGGFAS